MIATAESILPVFLLIFAGNVLRRLPLVDQTGWRGLEQLGYWFLYPALLFITILRADFSALALDAMIVSLLGAVLLMCALTYATWPLLRRTGLVAASEFSSVYQTSVRWNAFIALAIAAKTFPAEALGVIALAMVVIIIPVNVTSVAVVTHFADQRMNWPKLTRNIVLNPMILPCMLALALRSMPFGLYGPVQEALQLVGQAALGMGLVAIGAGLQPADILRPRTAMVLPVVLKLVVFPMVLIGLGLAMGLRGDDLLYLSLCAAVPTAMNGYLLARQLGGDAQLYASVVTMQTVVSFVTIPLMLAFARFVGG
ncbi:MAG: AEC family transporter [Rhizobiaceae bacterium]|nr:AEC family transporter [Rhizobiaceae bacterium]